MARALVFPGQGSQNVGMGKELADAFSCARDVFAEVDEALKQPLSQIMFNGPEAELTLTANAQPALMAVSLAVMRILEQEGGFKLEQQAKLVAGHSLGEYSALTAAKALSLADAARLLRIRGQAMQTATPVGVGAMAALLGLDFAQAQEVAKEAAQGQVCEAANDNADGQVVVSGNKDAVERAIEIAKGRGAKRSVLLPVSAPFHCALMAPAAQKMAESLSEVTINPPIVPLVANVLARETSDPIQIRDLLVKQVTGTVRWREGVLYMKSCGIDNLVEIGSGKVLSGLVKRIDKEMSGISLNTPADIENFLKSL